MARSPRIHYPGAIYHAMARGVDGREIFLDREDREKFLRVVERVKEESHANLLAYCLMSNHFHVALKIDAVSLSKVMQRILTSHSLSFNLKYKRTGHLFQARYKAVLCHDQAYLVSLIRYIHMNPVRAGLTNSPDQWPWSSHAEYHRQGRNGLVDTESDIPDLDAPPPADFQPWPGQDSKLSAVMLRTPADQPQSIEDSANACLHGSGLTMDCLRSKTRRREVTRIKRLVIQRGIVNGHSLTAIARWLRIGLSSAQHYLNDK
jgi:REP element-mobilizing transposase RayT